MYRHGSPFKGGSSTVSGWSLVLATVFAAGCSASDAVAPTAESVRGQPALDHAAATPDVNGNWNWRRTENLRMPDWFVLGVLNSVPGNNVAPEGPNTHARCTSEGTMILNQSNHAVSGVAILTASACTTRGGQSFIQPGIGLPLTVSDGVIRSRSFHFSLANLTVTPCPMRTVITEQSNGTATAFSGTGRCVLPGHPKSESVVVLPPPPGGTSKTLSFEAWR